MPDKESNVIKFGTYNDTEKPVVFPKMKRKIIFNEEADSYLRELLGEKLSNNENIPDILYDLFLKGES